MRLLLCSRLVSLEKLDDANSECVTVYFVHCLATNFVCCFSVRLLKPFLRVSIYSDYGHCPHSMWSRVYVTVQSPSVSSVCPVRPL